MNDNESIAVPLLHDISTAVARERNVGKLLGQVLEIAEKRLGMVRGTIALLAGDELRIEASARSLNAEERALGRYRIGEGVTGLVAKTGRAVVVPDVRRDPRFLNRTKARGKGDAVSFVCVPLVHGGQVVGTLSADREIRPGDRPLEEAVELLGIVANVVGEAASAYREQRAEREALVEENRKLRTLLSESPGRLIGECPEMREVYAQIRQVAPTEATVLVRGASGTGKELVARAIQSLSPRKNKPFVVLNCAALPEALVESELFGHERGAFTDARERRIGRAEAADGGTLFLDEIGDLTVPVQVKLLRFLQERTFSRVGSNEERHSDVRFIAATSRNLEEMMARGEFREDLYYRLAIFPIALPDLARRGGDVVLLARHFLEKACLKYGKQAARFSPPALDAMLAYAWPGNVRELENCVERAVLTARDDCIRTYNLPPALQSPEFAEDPFRPDAPRTLAEQLDALERRILEAALRRHGGNRSAAGRELGVSPRMMNYRLKRLGMGLGRAEGGVGFRDSGFWGGGGDLHFCRFAALVWSKNVKIGTETACFAAVPELARPVLIGGKTICNRAMNEQNDTERAPSRRHGNYRPAEERVRDWKEVELTLPEGELREGAARCLDCGQPFCHAWGCPLGNYVPDQNRAVAQGDWRRAWELLSANSDFPEFTSRVCPALCEGSCVHGLDSDAVSIRQNERRIVDRAFAEGWVVPRPPARENGRSVAVVGAGPAGLSAAVALRRRGWAVTVYEKRADVGGLLRYGIPCFKLAKTAVDRRRGLLEAEGVRFVTGVEVGRDLSADWLARRNDAVVVAIGTPAARDLPIPGRELAGIHPALDLLEGQNRFLTGEIPAPPVDAKGKRVLVVGGGDTGSDCVGTAIRQGAASVAQIEIMPKPPAARSPSTPWPQWPWMLRTSSSHEEGCERRWNLNSLRFVGEGGAVRGVEVETVEWEFTPEGRPAKFRPVPGTRETLDADLVLLAMGFTGVPADTPLVAQLGLSQTPRTALVSDPARNIYCVGDCATGASLVVRAIASGKAVPLG